MAFPPQDWIERTATLASSGRPVLTRLRAVVPSGSASRQQWGRPQRFAEEMPVAKSTPGKLDAAIADLARAEDLLQAAQCLIDIGAAISLTAPAVIDDYSSNRLLTAEDGRAMASVLGWDERFYQDWLEQRLYLVSPIAAVCRLTTRPFAWRADAITRAVEAAQPRQRVTWNLTPERGIHGGITVPIHLPRARVGSVGWFARTPDVDPAVVLATHGNALRTAANLVMDLVYARRADAAEAPEASSRLSERELECLSWAGLGRTDIEIGSIIYRSPATARFHIDNAIAKLGARNRTQAVAIAAQFGLIHPLDEPRQPDHN